ncbi:MAG: citrate synthase [Chloroflexota bacterium]
MTNPDTLTITDNRTQKSYDVSIEHETIKAIDLRPIKVTEDEFGTMTYDPGYGNTASCKSKVTYIDGDKGILRYRGYPIEQLAEQSTFLESSYLLINGELPTADELDAFSTQVLENIFIHENLVRLMQTFNHDAHPMGMLISALGFLSALYPDSRDVTDPAVRQKQMYRLMGQIPTIVAMGYRCRQGLPIIYPDHGLGYAGNFLQMLTTMPDRKTVDPVCAKALDTLFLLHGDHEQNCSAAVMRSIGSAHADPYSAMAGATAALYGPLHGGANEAVLRMLLEIESVDRVPLYIDRVKKREFRLMGFGHRVYKNYDPRAKIIKQVAYDVFNVVGTNPLIDVAMKLEQAALEDEFFVRRNLYPNVDFYSGIIYQALGFAPEMFTALFAIGRTPGWLAQWNEMLDDREQKIARPRQIYLGYDSRDYVAVDAR